MAAKNKSIFEQVTLEANDQSQDIDIRSGVVSLDYYEDIFSPTITAPVSYTHLTLPTILLV